MSTVERSTQTILPPLVHGERLNRATFHERYAAMPSDIKAELIGGVVYMASPVGYRHAFRDVDASFWAKYYASFTVGTLVGGNATVMLDDLGEHQPDCVLMISEEAGGQSLLDEIFIKGAPELVVEVSRSTRRLDLGPRKLDYERAGVLEYLFVGIEPEEVVWFVRRGERFEKLPLGEDGILRSEAFPGLSLDPAALLAGNGRRLIEVLNQGLATPEHADFVARLERANRAT